MARWLTTAAAAEFLGISEDVLYYGQRTRWKRTLGRELKSRDAKKSKGRTGKPGREFLKSDLIQLKPLLVQRSRREPVPPEQMPDEMNAAQFADLLGMSLHVFRAGQRRRWPGSLRGRIPCTNGHYKKSDGLRFLALKNSRRTAKGLWRNYPDGRITAAEAAASILSMSETYFRTRQRKGWPELDGDSLIAVPHEFQAANRLTTEETFDPIEVQNLAEKRRAPLATSTLNKGQALKQLRIGPKVARLGRILPLSPRLGKRGGGTSRHCDPAAVATAKELLKQDRAETRTIRGVKYISQVEARRRLKLPANFALHAWFESCPYVAAGKLASEWIEPLLGKPCRWVRVDQVEELEFHFLGSQESGQFETRFEFICRKGLDAPATRVAAYQAINAAIASGSVRRRLSRRGGRIGKVEFDSRQLEAAMGAAATIGANIPLSELQRNVIRVMRESGRNMFGEEIATAAGYQFNSYFRTGLSDMVDAHLLVKAGRRRGYALT